MLQKPESKYVVIALGGIALIWFVVAAGLLPLLRNKDLNKAAFAAQAGNCEAAFAILEELPDDTHLDPYIANQYTDAATLCASQLANPKRSQVIQETIARLERRAERHPQEPKTFNALAAYANLLLANEQDPAKAKELAFAAKTYLAKAQELSPGREELAERLIYTLLLEKEYAAAKEEALRCQARFPENTACQAWRLVAELWLGERDSLRLGSPDPPYAQDVARHFYLSNFLNQLLKFYLEQENYEQLVEVYPRLIRIQPAPQYYASLASAYDSIGGRDGWAEAARHALTFYQLQPAAKEEVRAFLKNVLAKHKAADPVRYNELRHQAYKDIEKAFPDIFESL